MRITNCQQHTHVIWQGLTATQVATKLDKIRAHGGENALRLVLQSKTSILAIHQIKPAPFYALALEKPLEFWELISLAASFGQQLIKGWLLETRKEVIRHEASLSTTGLSLDGLFTSITDLDIAEKLAISQAHSRLQKQPYVIGGNAGIFVTDKKELAEFNTVEVKTERSFNQDKGSLYYMVKGLLPAQTLFPILTGIIATPHFKSLELYLPMLPAAVEMLGIYRYAKHDLYRCELTFTHSAYRIVSNTLVNF